MTIQYNTACVMVVNTSGYLNFIPHFQVFVANPNKTKPILDILLRNKEKLIDFLTKFHTDRTGGQPILIWASPNQGQ